VRELVVLDGVRVGEHDVLDAVQAAVRQRRRHDLVLRAPGAGLGHAREEGGRAARAHGPVVGRDDGLATARDVWGMHQVEQHVNMLIQQMAQDPLVQMQQAELQISAKEAETKLLKVKGDLQIKAEELALKAREGAAKMGEDPNMAAMRTQQEIMQAQELHALEVANQQQAQAQQQQVHQQGMGQSEEQHKMAMMQKMMQAQQPPNRG
jgi:hypothetical protein